MIYFISDLHLGHENVIGYSDRPFSSVQEMEEALVSRFNQTVTSEDTVYLVGDFCLGNPEHIKDHLSKFKKVKELILIKGNHDRLKTVEEARDVGFTNMVKKLIIAHDGLKIGLSHFPFKPKGQMPGLSNILPEEVDFLIHGHVHHNFKTMVHESGKLMINVSVEAIDYRPISIDQILEIYRSQK